MFVIIEFCGFVKIELPYYLIDFSYANSLKTNTFVRKELMRSFVFEIHFGFNHEVRLKPNICTVIVDVNLCD